MLTKASFTGIGTGIVLSVVMYYPLYVIVPGSYVVEWSRGSTTLGIALSLFGVVLLLVGGLVTARVAKTNSRKQGALLGAMTGIIAGLILFLGLGAAAAGVAGSGDLLAHGPKPASGEEQFLILLTESVLRNIVWTHQVFWGLLLGSATLGAIGGALAPLQVPDKSAGIIELDSQLACILAMAALLTSGLSLWITVVIFALLPTSVANAADKVNYTPSIPPTSILNWSAGTILVIFLSVMLCTLLAIRAESTTTSRKRRLAAKVAAYVAVFLWAAVFGVLFLFLNRELASNPFFIVGGILSVIMGVQMIRIAIALRKQLSQTPLEAPLDVSTPGILQHEYWRINFKRLILGVSAASFMPIFAGTVQSISNIVLIPVRMIVVLASYGYPGTDPNPVVDFTSRSLVYSLFVSQCQIVFGAFVVVFLLVTLLILVLLLIGSIVTRLRDVAADIRHRNN